MKILVIEDNVDVNNIINETLQKEGYVIDSSFDGLDGIQKFYNNKYDLILLDLMLPLKSGDQILKEIRQKSKVPIIILSAKDMISTKVDLLKLGADDYITKPFDLEELSARVFTVLRRVQDNNNDEILQYKDIELNTASKEVKVSGKLLELTAKEYKIMELLLSNKKKIFSKASIYEAVWQDNFISDDGAVKTHMSNLRGKLKSINSNDEYIETVWGLGYRLKN